MCFASSLPSFSFSQHTINNMGGSINIISHQPSGKKRFCLKFQFTPPYTLQPKHFMFRCDSTCKIPNFICLPADQHFWFYYETPQTRWNFDEGRKKTLLWFLYHIHQIFDVKTKREKKKRIKYFNKFQCNRSRNLPAVRGWNWVFEIEWWNYWNSYF